MSNPCRIDLSSTDIIYHIQRQHSDAVFSEPQPFPFFHNLPKIFTISTLFAKFYVMLSIVRYTVSLSAKDGLTNLIWNRICCKIPIPRSPIVGGK